MELYYKDLISKDASLDKLVDDLMLLVQGADEFAEAAGVSLPNQQSQEITTRLARLKDACRRAKQEAISRAQATDKLLRQYPYSALGVAFSLGLLAGALLNRRN